MKFFIDYRNRVAVLLTVGLILIVAHYASQPGLGYIFIPQVGMALLLGTVLLVLAYERNKLKEAGLGPKTIWVPLAVIAGSAVLRLVVQPDRPTLAGALFMSSMFGLYVVSRKYGERALAFFVPLVIAGAVSIIAQALVVRGGENPGMFSEYATAAQFLVFGWVVAPRRSQWWLAAVVVAGLYFSGAEEAVFYVIIGAIAMLIRRDYSRKILLPVGVGIALILIGWPLGLTQTYWGRAFTMVSDVRTVIMDDSLTPEERDALLQEATNQRWLEGWRLHRPVSPLGYGINLTYHYKGIPHNIILLVTDQLGPLAAAAWCVAVVAGYKKTKWKYAFLGLALFGVFQPFVWTKMAPWLWATMGAATGSQVTSSYIFR